MKHTLESLVIIIISDRISTDYPHVERDNTIYLLFVWIFECFHLHTHTATYYTYITYMLLYTYAYDVYVTLLCAESASSGKRRLKSLWPEIFQIRGEHNIIIINGRGLNVSTHRAALCENEKRAALYTLYTHLRLTSRCLSTV